jgi:hypothetical protein
MASPFLPLGICTDLLYLDTTVFLDFKVLIFDGSTHLRSFPYVGLYEDVSKSFRTGRLEQELQMVQLSATRCSCITIL